MIFVEKIANAHFGKTPFLAVQDATLYSEDKIDKKILSTGR